MILDAHSHFLQGFWPCDNLPKSFDDLGVNADEVLATLDELGVKKVVTLAQEMTRTQGQWLGSNQLAADLQRRFQGHIYAIAAFEPVTPVDQFNGQRFAEVRELVKSGNVIGLLITPPYGQFALNDRRAYPFYQMAVEYDVPIYIHMAAMGGPPQNAPLERASLLTLDQIVVDFPNLRLNIEHMAWPWTEELLAIMNHGRNVHTDICLLARRPHMLAWQLTMANDYGFLDRIFWGTDYLGSDLKTYADRVRREVDFLRNQLNQILRGCGWPTPSAEQIDGLLRENSLKFLRI